MNKSNAQVVCIGGGPAGLTAAYLLSKKNKVVTVLEADPVYVGGISRTARYKGFYFDIGGHRFFSKSKEVEDFWDEILEGDFLDRPRKSRIFYKQKFFSYPLKAFEALFKLGILESILSVLSYMKAKMFPTPNPTNVEDWVSNQFGKRLYRTFFKTYTEKVWGMKCKEISADWAAQRIKGLSLTSAVMNAILPKRKPKNKGEVIKTLIDSFRYPRKGPGMMWETCAKKIQGMGNKIEMGAFVNALDYNSNTKKWTITYKQNSETSTIECDHVISTAPMKELVNSMTPKVKPEALNAANKLRYRDFLTVSLVLNDKSIFDDNWIYIHDPQVKVGRIQNFKSWSPEMIPDPKLTCYGLEYFCFEGDNLWDSPDETLIALAKKELSYLGLADQKDILDGCVVRQKKAYPVYDDEYQTHVETIRKELTQNYPNLHLVGRNGMHKYNNQDHAMMTAMLTVENILEGRLAYNVWAVNEDAEYHEAGKAGAENSASGLRLVPQKVK